MLTSAEVGITIRHDLAPCRKCKYFKPLYIERNAKGRVSSVNRKCYTPYA